MEISTKQKPAAWLLLVFTLPTAKASERVGVWRKLQRYGAIGLPASGYVLPNNPMNQERFEWLATSIRSSNGEAAVAQVCSFDDLQNQEIQRMFIQARTRDYHAIEKDLQKISKIQRGDRAQTTILRLKKRLEQIVEIDFFASPMRTRVEQALQRLEDDGAQEKTKAGKKNRKDYERRTWITRPHPGIDRVSSAWLILRYIDPRAKFIFGNQPQAHPDAIPFDMFKAGGFGHVGNDCTLETLVKSFGIKDSRVRLMAQAVHDADLADEHFGKTEALGIDRILDGWNKQGLPGEEVLRRGIEMIEGLYNGIR